MADTVTAIDRSGGGDSARSPYPMGHGMIIITRTTTITITKTIHHRHAVRKQPEPKIKPIIENLGIGILSIETMLMLFIFALWLTYLGCFIGWTIQSTPDDRVDNIGSCREFKDNSYPDSHDGKERGNKFSGAITFGFAVELVLFLPLVIGILNASFEFCTVWLSVRLGVFIYEINGFVLLCANGYEGPAIVVIFIYLLYRTFSIVVISAFVLNIYRSRFRVGQVGTVDV